MDALISGRAGLALVVDGGELASIHASEPERSIPRRSDELHFLAGEARDFVTVENASRSEIVRELVRARRREESLQLVLILLDIDLADDIRAQAASELDEGFSEDLAIELENVLYARPLPAAADLGGALRVSQAEGVSRVLALLERLSFHQAAIREVWTAWERIPERLFGDLKQFWQSVAIREGAFRELVRDRATGGTANDTYVMIASNLGIRSLPNHRAVLQAWISPFFGRSDIRLQPEKDAEPQAAEVRQYGRRYGTRRRRRSVDRAAILAKVERQKAAIEKALKARNFTKTRRYVDDLVEYQLSTGEPEYAVKSLCDLAKRAENLGHVHLQLDWTTRSIELKADDAWAWAQHADALLNLRRYPEALAAYRQSELSGNRLVAKTGSAEVLKAMGRFQDALEAYEEVKKQHPEDVVAKNGSAEVLKAMGRFQDALEAYEEVKKQHPENVVAKIGLASLLAISGEAEDALAILPEGETSSLDDWVALHVRATLQLRLGENQKAIEICELALDDCPWYVQRDYFRTTLAVAHLQGNNPEKSASTIADVDNPEIQLPVCVVGTHAFGLAGHHKQANETYSRLDRFPFLDRELVEELDRRFISRTGQLHDESWLLEKELLLLAGVLVAAGVARVARRNLGTRRDRP